MNQIIQKRVSEPVTIVIFGASGDLTHRKLIPALYSAFIQKLLPDNFAIIGFSRREYDNLIFRKLMTDSLKEFLNISSDENNVELFMKHIFYHPGDISIYDSFISLKNFILKNKLPSNHLYYLSIMPSLFESTVKSLKQANMISRSNSKSWTRVVVEKPFGNDLSSALLLNKNLLKFLDESQIFRIDHFLGKETVQNILSFRFANTIFEPVFNRSHIDHIQITAAEEIGMEKGRGGYYDEYGALRDMLTNHLLQLMCLVTMEAPADLSANAIRNEKVKVLRSAKIDKLNNINEAVFRGQYESKKNPDGTIIKSYHEEEKISPTSDTETFIAIRLMIDNWRWAGVPILLRTGKRMKKKSRMKESRSKNAAKTKPRK